MMSPYARATPSLRLDVEFLAERAPLFLLLANVFGGALGRAAATGSKPECQQPVADLGTAQVQADLVIEPRDDLSGRARRRHDGEEAVHHHAGHRLAQ